MERAVSSLDIAVIILICFFLFLDPPRAVELLRRQQAGWLGTLSWFPP
jgi:hypothetical protein